MKRKIIGIAVVLVIIIGVVAWRITFRNADTTVGSEKPGFEMSAYELYRVFSENETEANNLYLNKVIRLTGKVRKVEGTEEGINVYLGADEEASGVICNFVEGVVSKTDFVVGTNVVVQGLCSGYLFDVVLIKCDLVR